MKKYGAEVHAFIEDKIAGRTVKELVELVNTQFDLDFTESKMRAYKSNHGLKNGLNSGTPKGSPSKVFPQDVKDYIQANYKGVGPTEMCAQLNDHFGGTTYEVKQLRTYYKNHKLNSGLTGYFKKGQIPFNKGRKGVCAPGCEKSHFHKGHTPHNTLPVGTELVKGDGYRWRKIADPNTWKQSHILLWEAAHGPVPKDNVLIFLNGDKNDVRIDNLALVTRAEHLELTRSKLKQGSWWLELRSQAQRFQNSFQNNQNKFLITNLKGVRRMSNVY